MTIETPRLRLTYWKPNDWHKLCPITEDSEVVRYISQGQPWSRERVVRFVSRQIACFEAHGYCLWKLVLRDSGRTIGFCGLQPSSYSPEIDCSWCLARPLWGCGLATESAREAVRDGFERCGLQRIVSTAEKANHASIRMMEKLGMDLKIEASRDRVFAILHSATALNLQKPLQALNSVTIGTRSHA
jgi:RimJ/RimL family protein N-acetyltransferase